MFYGGVSQEVLDLLKLGDQVIAKVRALVPHGAGNQSDDHKRTSGQSAHRTALVQRTYGTDWSRPMRNAAATIKFGAGNCQEQAAVAYLFLRESLGAGYKVTYCVAWNAKHSFATIGVPNTDSEEKVVVVDSWPIHAQAVLWKHHFCRNDPNLQILRNKQGAQGKQKITTCQVKHYATVNAQKELILQLYNAPAGPSYNHQWCSSCNEIIKYETSLI
jgi:hypothetical protein